MRVIFLIIAWTVFLQLNSCNARGQADNSQTGIIQSETVEVYYFHFTRRCETCLAVENESRKAIEELYPSALEEGRIIFKSLNLEEEEGKLIAQKFNIAGQTLLVIRFGEKIDLTNQGFMFARTDPEKLKKALQEAIGKI
jgi:hypothetical protein